MHLYIIDESFREHAINLIAITNKINIITEIPKDECKVYLQLDYNGLAIVCDEFKLTYIKDLYTNLIKRLKALNQELLVKSVKVKGLDKLHVLDITAGLGRDSILLANAGHHVTMIEKNPILAVILSYVIQNKIVPGSLNLKLIHDNSHDYLLQSDLPLSHVIYMDPMFQDNSKAKAKKEMQLITILLALDEDISIANLSSQKNLIFSNEKLFNLAHKHATNRVIVKRDDKQASIVDTPKVSFSKLGKTVRYDIYVTLL